MNTYLEIVVQERLETFDYESGQFINLYKFYHFLNNTNTSYTFNDHLDILIEKYRSESPGEYEYQLFIHRITFKIHDWYDEVEKEKSIKIELKLTTDSIGKK